VICLIVRQVHCDMAPQAGCKKSSASEAPNPGRHHVGIPGGVIISQCPGDLVGIRMGIGRGFHVMTRRACNSSLCLPPKILEPVRRQLSIARSGRPYRRPARAGLPRGGRLIIVVLDNAETQGGLCRRLWYRTFGLRCRQGPGALRSYWRTIRGGKLRALAVTGATRSPALPSIPTISEFLPGYEVSGYWGVAASRGTLTEIIEQLIIMRAANDEIGHKLLQRLFYAGQHLLQVTASGRTSGAGGNIWAHFWPKGSAAGLRLISWQLPILV
jgi:Tripartite tricarboxylate transporter family receptor